MTFEEYLVKITESKQMQRDAAKRNTGKRTKEEEIAWAKQSEFNFKFELEGYSIIPSVHSASQARDRRPDFGKSEWKRLHRKTLWYVKDNKISNGTFLFYNEEMQQGYIANVRQKTINVITVLPKGKYNPMGGKMPGKTDLALVEEIKQALLESGVICENLQVIETIYI